MIETLSLDVIDLLPFTIKQKSVSLLKKTKPKVLT